MIRYRELKIENYKSIVTATVVFTPGVFQVVGVTNNGEYSSNGSGKSSILQALTLVLYNKDFQGAPLDSVSNRYTGEQFKVSLLVDIEKGGVFYSYLIVNDRASKRLSIHRNGKALSTTTAKSLKLITELLGMTEATFKFTHYITTNSILELTTNLSNATLFNEVLQVTELSKMGQDLLEVKKNITKDIDNLTRRYGELNSMRKLLNITDKYDLIDLREQEESLKLELEEVDKLQNVHILPLLTELNESRELIRDKEMELRQKKKSAKNGTCSLCGSEVFTVDQLRELHSGISNLEITIGDLHTSTDEVEHRYESLLEAYNNGREDVQTKLTKVQKDLDMGEQLVDIHSELLKDVEEYSEERFQAVTDTLEYKRGLSWAITQMRDAIKSGRIYEEVMQEFFKLVNINIQRYRKVINFNAYEVTAESYRSGMVAILKYHGDEVPVESLSNGEKARLSLLLLSALLESMAQITNSESNFLALDEATSSFDKSGIEELSALFNHLKVLEQSVFIITHGTELQQVEFDGVLKVTKEDHKSIAEFIKDG